MRRDFAAVDAATVVPLERWDLTEQEASLGTAPIRFAVFMSGISQFDPVAFALSENEAVLMDPQQRLLLECAEESLASVKNQKLPSTAIKGAGVFVVRFIFTII